MRSICIDVTETVSLGAFLLIIGLFLLAVNLIADWQISLIEKNKAQKQKQRQ